MCPGPAPPVPARARACMPDRQGHSFVNFAPELELVCPWNRCLADFTPKEITESTSKANTRSPLSDGHLKYIEVR